MEEELMIDLDLIDTEFSGQLSSFALARHYTLADTYAPKNLGIKSARPSRKCKGEGLVRKFVKLTEKWRRLLRGIDEKAN